MKLALALAALLATTASVSAAPVTLTDSPYAQARSVINVVFGNYIRGLTGVQVQSAVVDLDGDNKGEIVARFVHSSACRDGTKACRTVVLRHMGGDWKIVLDRFADALDVSKGYRDVPAPIKVDATEWSWDGGRYLPKVDTLGSAMTFKPVTDKARESISKAFGQPAKLSAAGIPVTYSYTQEGLSKGNDLMLVKMEGSVVCGKLNGCPVRVLKKEGDAWRPVLSSSTTGKVLTSKMTRQGYRDILLETKDGALQMGWTGSAYAVADRIEGTTK
ncbi:hypothetical protein OIU34_17985 [Pararhizobium sp. BT-229]|uniref:hypothetical protein n=1 Tax=Pararhizobium sp. BT-229 TaxID=2986923 RepID=UPI0021F7D3D2|nr:hypothetical protein [Pararhizobium sp. BT-229]MCV9963769.1 hypothetical protein [Pararhizobium sp. BT-229]